MSNTFNGEMFSFGEAKRPSYGVKPASVFGKGQGRPPSGKGFAPLAPLFGTFRNRAGAKPGTPVYFGERPEGRPYGNDCGQRSALANHTQGFNRGNHRVGEESPGVKLKKFSWEQNDEL